MPFQAMRLRSGFGGADDFSANTLSSYTMSQDSGAPSASIASGTLTLTTPSGTANAVLRRNDVSIQDGFVEADVDYANDSGIVLRFQDNANYYLLGLSDDSGVNSAVNLLMYRKVAGSFTNIGSTLNISWPRGTQKIIRFQAVGSALRAFVDGDLVLSATDSNIAPAGSIGMRGNYVLAGAGNKFNALRWSSL